MKTTILFFILFGITFLGCSDNFDNTIVSTSTQSEELTTSANPENLNKLTGFEEFPGSPNYEVLVHSTFSKSIKNQVICPIIVVSQPINGEWGGWVTLDTNYTDIDGREIYVYARLRILPGAYQGIINIEMRLDLSDASAQFFPEMAFDREVRYDLWFQGIDLKELGYNESGDVAFAYFAESGDVELIESNVSQVDFSQSKISVHNAKLYHFSRYGWVR